MKFFLKLLFLFAVCNTFAFAEAGNINQYGAQEVTIEDSSGSPYSNSNPLPVSVNSNVIERYNVATPYNGTISSAATWTAVNITDVNVFIVDVRDFPGEGRIAFDDATTNYQTLSGLLGGETVYTTEANVSTVNLYTNSATGNYQFSVIPR